MTLIFFCGWSRAGFRPRWLLSLFSFCLGLLLLFSQKSFTGGPKRPIGGLIPTCAFRCYCDRLTGKGFTRRKGVPMSSLTRAANHLTVEQVKEKLKEAKDVVQYKRWLIVYNALIAP